MPFFKPRSPTWSYPTLGRSTSYTPHPTGGVLAGELNKDLVILENNIPVVGSANLEVEIMSSNIPTISRSRECTVCTSGHENDQKMRNVQSVLAVMRMIG